MARRVAVHDPVTAWFGEGAPGWIAGLAAAICWVVVAAGVVLLLVFGGGDPEDGRDPGLTGTIGILVLLVPYVLVIVALPVLVIDALVAWVGRTMGWRVGEVMVAVAVLWVTWPLLVL